MEETVENVRLGDGHEKAAGVGEIEGEGDPSRTTEGDVECSIVELSSRTIVTGAGAAFFCASFVSILSR
jgi:hypothetical protein